MGKWMPSWAISSGITCTRPLEKNRRNLSGGAIYAPIGECFKQDGARARTYLIRKHLDGMATGNVEWGRGDVWGSEVNACDIQANELNVGKLFSPCTDMEERANRNIELTRRLGSTDNFATNQCAAIHLAAASAWAGGGPETGPDRGRLDSLATALRGPEMDASARASRNLQSTPSLRAKGLGSAIHDGDQFGRAVNLGRSDCSRLPG